MLERRRRRRTGGDGGLAAVRPAQLSHLVGLGDVGRPRGAGGALPPRPRHHDRHGRGLAVRARRRADRGDASCTTGPGPRWPLIGRARREWVIGPVFIHGIASRTLAGIKRQVEAAERPVSDDRGPASGGHHRHRRDHPDRPGGRRPVGRAPAAGAPRSAAITRFDPSAFKSRIAGEVDGFHRHRPHRGAPGPPARPLLAVHHRGDPDGARGRRPRPRAARTPTGSAR